MGIVTRTEIGFRAFPVERSGVGLREVRPFPLRRTDVVPLRPAFGGNDRRFHRLS